MDVICFWRRRTPCQGRRHAFLWYDFEVGGESGSCNFAIALHHVPLILSLLVRRRGQHEFGRNLRTVRDGTISQRKRIAP